MAYTLIEAGRLWKTPAYSHLGRQMMAQIAKTEVADLPGFGPMLMPGPTGFQHDHVWTLNPSYLPLFLFERLAQVDPAGPWRQIALGHSRACSSRAPATAMPWIGWIMFPATAFIPRPSMQPGNKESDAPGGSYDAIRVYLWAGMLMAAEDPRTSSSMPFPAMSVYLANHDAPPEKVSDQGIPMAQDGPVGFSAAVLPYLRAFPDLSSDQRQADGSHEPAEGSVYGIVRKGLGVLRSESCPVRNRLSRWQIPVWPERGTESRMDALMRVGSILLRRPTADRRGTAGSFTSPGHLL